MTLFPCAKINLGLNIVEKRDDGYHNLETVFYPVPIYDTLTVEEAEEQDGERCMLTVEGTDDLCPMHKNLVWKAYDLLSKHYALPAVKAILRKDIPSQAGMGGGSSDAAYMLRALNELFSLHIPTDELQQYAAQLGADCALFITTDAEHPTAQYAEGIGEKLQSFTVPALQQGDMYLALIKPDAAVSTRQAFQGITPHHPLENCRDILQRPMTEWRDALINDFEASIFPQLPTLAEIKQDLYAHGALYAAMSGSGSTIFAFFNSNPQYITQQYGGIFNKVIKI